MSENVFTEQSNESALGPGYALIFHSLYKYKPSLIQRFEMKDLLFNGESAFQHKGVLVTHQRRKT